MAKQLQQAPHIAFVGGGNMAASMLGGLIASGHPPDRISAADPFPESLERLRAVAPIAVFGDNAAAVSGADIIILAVKPQVMAAAADSIAAAVQTHHTLLISIAAGVTIASMQKRLGPKAAIVRSMPNTPALLSCGASGLFANDNCTPRQREYAEHVMGAVGITCWVDKEQELDAITALSGSGPAYFFLLIESMIDAGIKLGLSRATAAQLTLQTSLGAARMAMESDVDVVELRRRVTSPGGTTERAIQSFEQEGLRAIVARAMQAANERAAEMAKAMG